MIIKEGSKWSTSDGRIFVVIHVIDQENHTWIHYRQEGNVDEPREYSCYQESFQERFRELPA